MENPKLIRSNLDLGLFIDVTLRDLFAGFALAGLLAEPNDATVQEISKGAYFVADRMLEVRNAK